MKVLHVVGARPNFMKAAPVHGALSSRASVKQLLVHTGQHYDATMSDVFFQQLGLPTPDINLEVGAGSHARQTAQVMEKLEPVLISERPDWLLVYGDVNSTVAAALTAVKLGIRTAHVEAGLRSRDRAMPEEHNRIVTDHLSDAHFTPSEDADQNLMAEGISRNRIHLVGNVMIDTLIRLLPMARSLDPLGLFADSKPFILATLHRPANVDDPLGLSRLMESLERISHDIPIIFPVHPRTRQKLNGRANGRVKLVEPLGYLEFLALQSRATAVITDSGGVQEETTYLGIPCLTLRENTERPITISIGTNELIGKDLALLQAKAEQAVRKRWKKGAVPPLWDGKASERITDILCHV